VGIDPICKAGIFGASDESRVQLFAERLSGHHKDLQPDFIICRHTLEHIADPIKFLMDIRLLTNDRQDVCLYLDVPDTKRIIDEGAFWDVYYEHAHYFTTESLIETLQQSGFVIEDSSREFDEQYLCITARPAHRQTNLRDSSNFTEYHYDTNELMQLFETTSEKICAWKNWFSDNSNARTVLWGGGSKAVSFISNLTLRDEILSVVDIHPRKQGCYLPGSGHDVISPARLISLSPDNVIVMNPAYLNEIRITLNELGIAPHIYSVNNPEIEYFSGKTC
jgi:hypothetical protein